MIDQQVIETEIDGEKAVLTMTAEIVSAFVSNNTVRAAELPDLIATVFTSLTGAGAPKATEEPAPELKPAVSVKKSVTDDYIISLEDGRKFKSMKRYLSGLGMTPDDYRAKWGLPRDYPMVAPAYATRRSELAKAAGLGASRRAVAAAKSESSPAPIEEVMPEAAGKAPAKRGRGRPKKMA